MAIGDLTEARLNGGRFAESIRGHPAEFWTPPLAPTGAPASGDILLREDHLGPVTREEDAFESWEQADLPAIGTSFASGRKLIAGTAPSWLKPEVISLGRTFSAMTEGNLAAGCK